MYTRILLALTLCVLAAASLKANTYTVTSTADSGSGSLRQAILDCNAQPGNDTIDFNISGMAPHTISVSSSSLPALTNAGTVIDGTTQAANGYQGNGPKIVISGISLNAGHGLSLNAPNCELYGLFIRDMPYNGLSINSGASGFVLGAAGKGNVISGNSYRGVLVEGADNGRIQGNYIGVNETGAAALPNLYFGLALQSGADNNLIGGTGAGEGNVISSNLYDGISITCSSNNTLYGNMVGVDVNGNGNLGNNYSGISLEHGGFFNPNCPCSGNTIGGIGPGEKNVIANNLYYGLNISGAGSNHNRVRGNAIYCNNYDGFSLVDGNYNLPNGNNGYASPQISSASAAGATGTAPANALIDLYADDQCNNCEPNTYIGTTQANSAGAWTYSGNLFGNVTAMAVDTSNGNTSENSSCVFVSAGAPPNAGFNSSNTSICAGECLSFSDQSTGIPSTWNWSFPGSQTSSSTQQNPSSICYNTPGTYSVSLTVSNAIGTDSFTAVNFITVNAVPTAGVTGPSQLCFGDSVNLNATGGTTYSWFPTNGLSSSTAANPTAFPGATTTYTVTATGAGGCTDTASLTLAVQAPPTVVANPDQGLCPGDTADLFAVVSNGQSGYWSPGGMVSDSLNTNTLGFPSQTTTFVYTAYTGANQTGCVSTDSTTITVYPAPALPMITQVVDTLFASTAASYQWYLNGSPIPGAISVSYVPTGAGTYTVLTTDNNGCPATSMPFVLVNLLETDAGRVLDLWPNPNAGAFHLSFQGQAHETATLTISNALGQTVLSRELLTRPMRQEFELDISEVAEGLYFLELQGEGYQMHRPFRVIAPGR